MVTMWVDCLRYEVIPVTTMECYCKSISMQYSLISIFCVWIIKLREIL